MKLIAYFFLAVSACVGQQVPKAAPKITVPEASTSCRFSQADNLIHCPERGAIKFADTLPFDNGNRAACTYLDSERTRVKCDEKEFVQTGVMCADGAELHVKHGVMWCAVKGLDVEPVMPPGAITTFGKNDGPLTGGMVGDTQGTVSAREWINISEAPDVEAVKHEIRYVDAWFKCDPDDYVGTGNDVKEYSCHPSKPYTCADKSRILLHDEQTPPKYWCHKPQVKPLQ
jgi:hypothetical protein